jgi:hypothetical protein
MFSPKRKNFFAKRKDFIFLVLLFVKGHKVGEVGMGNE